MLEPLELRGSAVKLAAITAFDQSVVAHLTLQPDQEQFAGSLDRVFEQLQSSRNPTFKHPFAIVARDQVVGFFVLRERDALPEWAATNVITMHSFRIAQPVQGQGFGKAGTELAVRWIRKQRPGVEHLMLAVNARNSVAKAAYLRCGFVDTGATYSGAIGMQHLLTYKV
jgi:cysteine synthase A